MKDHKILEWCKGKNVKLEKRKKGFCFCASMLHFSAFFELYIFSFAPFQNFVIFRIPSHRFLLKTEKKVDQITEDLRVGTNSPFRTSRALALEVLYDAGLIFDRYDEWV